MSTTDPTIIYTLTDEAPALATRSLLPIIEAFASAADIAVETRDISLAARILSVPDRLDPSQQVGDALAELGALTSDRMANIIKLPNISAPLPQMEAAITELRSQGFDIPEYPQDPSTDDEHEIAARYNRVKGSAVNPVLREGNSDRRAPAAVKNYARRHPHSMGAWSPESRTRVATMSSGDFRSNERSTTVGAATELRIELVGDDGGTTVLAGPIPVGEGTIVDTSVMEVGPLVDFLGRQCRAALDEGLLLSVHLKATMMKVSDPIIFGHAVSTYFGEALSRHADALARVGANPNDGLASILSALDELDRGTADTIRADIAAALESGPDLAMVNSDRGITNLHVPSDVIVDASMPAMIRTSGQMWNAEGNQQDTLAVIPDSSYAGVYQVVIDDCRVNGAFDPTTMGSVPNVGLMARKAEEYGSHDTTFEIDRPGVVRTLDSAGTVLSEHPVAAGDIWRMCRVVDEAVRDWVRLAVGRARATGAPAVFWLDGDRPHDAQLIAKVERTLAALDTDGVDVRVLAPVAATQLSVDRIRQGLDTISVTGNVLRDYLTDLFPILELGTSAKMLSVVPLMAGGGLFETGAGGSAPKHVQQFTEENHLRWDSLGEFLALAVSFEHLAVAAENPTAALLSRTLDEATGLVLENEKSPSRRVNELDNRGSHFYLALYWAEALAAQSDHEELAARFAPLATALRDSEEIIVAELNAVQGAPVDLGGYYRPDGTLAEAAMRPSPTLNRLIDGFVH